MKNLIIIISAMAMLAGCASTGQLKQLQAENASLRAEKANYNSKVFELESNITELKRSIATLNDNIAMITNENAALTQQTADQQAKLNQNQVILQVDQERLERLEKLLVQERARTEDLKNKTAQAGIGLNAN